MIRCDILVRINYGGVAHSRHSYRAGPSGPVVPHVCFSPHTICFHRKTWKKPARARSVRPHTMDTLDDDDDAPFLDISDTEVAVQLLLRDCPPGARTADDDVPIAMLHCLYSIVDYSTEVDQDLESMRLANKVRILKLPAHGDERVIVSVDDYTRALRNSGCEGADALAEALPQLTGLSVHASELQHVLGARARTMVDGLVDAGWLMPTSQAAHATIAGPDEAPVVAEDDAWLWQLPRLGRLVYGLGRCRGEVLSLLHKQKFHRALSHTVEQSPALRKLMRDSKLHIRQVLRDVVGKRLVARTASATGTVLELTPAGVQAAHVSRGRKRRR